MSLTSINLGLKEVLSDPVRRQAFFRAITQDDIADQIRALRKTRRLTQTKFAALADMKQSAVSRIEQAEYASWTLATLFRVAAALDARWRMILEPAEDAVKEFEGIEDASQPSAAEAEDHIATAPNEAPEPALVQRDEGSNLFTTQQSLAQLLTEWLRFSGDFNARKKQPEAAVPWVGWEDRNALLQIRSPAPKRREVVEPPDPCAVATGVRAQNRYQDQDFSPQ